jgi:hypothetical protein
MRTRTTSTRGLASSRIAFLTAVLAAATIAPLPAKAASVVHLPWHGLSAVVGKTVSIAMPGGSLITGKATAAEADALLVDVTGTTDAKAYSKGPVRVPRATLHRFQMRTKGKAFRVLGTAVGSGAGFVLGAVAAWNAGGGISSARHTLAAGTFFGIWAGGTVGGYFIGDAADKHWTTVEITE